MLKGTISLQSINKGLSYSEFKELAKEEIKEGDKDTSDKCDPYLEYKKLNIVRIERLDKTVTLNEKTINRFQKLLTRLYWIVLVESWCGDVAQNVPIISKMADISPNIELKLLPRDQNLDIMDAFLTNGGWAIPKLICLSADKLSVLGTWGPRPKDAQEMMDKYKANPIGSKEEIIKKIHLWYSKDKGVSIQREFLSLLSRRGVIV